MPFLPFLPDLPLKINNKFRVANSFTQLVSNIRPVSMKKLKCKHCPIPGCHSKFLVRLANHLTQVYELSEIEQKYWLQFAKLQNTNAICAYSHLWKRILLGSASLSYTRIALVFCNFANWNQHFRSISGKSSFTKVKRIIPQKITQLVLAVQYRHKKRCTNCQDHEEIKPLLKQKLKEQLQRTRQTERNKESRTLGLEAIG